MLENIMTHIDEVHICPHCNERMACCEAPPIHVGDGLGWGSEIMFICLNDSCSLYKKGWDYIDVQYGHKGSYRYMELPGSKESNVMMVGSEDAFKTCVIDIEVLKSQNKRYQREKDATKALDTAVEDKNLKDVLYLVLDEAADKSNRLRAISIMCEINDISVIDPIRNHKFRESSVEQEANMAISQILRENFKRECPHCSELVKSQAQKCKHCQADLA